MIDPKKVAQAEAVSIVDYLASKGSEPVKCVGKELLYYSPLRDKNKPSFWVNVEKNKFKDYTVEEHRGNSINLVQLMEGCNFPTAVAKLLTFSGQSDTSRLPYVAPAAVKRPLEQKTHIQFPFVRPILIQYVEERGISYQLGKRYLHEVMTTASDRYYYYVGFKNDLGGFALRNRSFKRCFGNQTITTINDNQTRESVMLFEGFFDFLSYLTYHRIETPQYPTIVLNSISNLAKAYPFLVQFNEIHYYRDRDKQGEDSLARMRKNGLLVRDFAERKGFEPSMPCDIPAFQASQFNHSCTSLFVS